MVEGPIRTSGQNVTEHALEVVEHIARRNPNGLEPDMGKHGVTRCIAAWVRAHPVRLSVNLDYEPPVEAGEIGHTAVARKLTTEAMTVRALSKLLPEDDFWQRHLVTELACTSDVRVRRTDRSMSHPPRFGPSTMLRMVPLPVPGRI